jgi:hypothetical protein
MEFTNILELKEYFKQVPELSLEETLQFRKDWRQAFAKNTKVLLHNCYRCGNNTRWSSYDWNHFKANFYPIHDNSLQVICQEAIPDTEEVVVFEEDCAVPAIVISLADVKKLLDGNTFKGDLYFTPRHFSWTLVFPYEDSLCGPYFVKNKVNGIAV